MFQMSRWHAFGARDLSAVRSWKKCDSSHRHWLDLEVAAENSAVIRTMSSTLVPLLSNML